MTERAREEDKGRERDRERQRETERDRERQREREALGASGVHKMSRTNSHWESLPTELLTQVFSYCHPVDLCRACMVHGHWRQAAQDEAVWRRLFLKSWGHFTFAAPFLTSQTRAPNGRYQNHNGRSSGGGHSAGNEEEDEEVEGR